MPSTTSFNQGDIVLVPFPFTDLTAIKQRPALVISPRRLNDTRPDLVVVAITSQIPAALGEDEVRLPDAELAACGLPKPSIIKLGKIFTIHQGLIRKNSATCRGGGWRTFERDCYDRLNEGAMKESRYELIIFWDESDQIFVVDVPELPGCMAHGRSKSEAIDHAEAAIDLWIGTAKEDGIPIPEPRGRLMFA